MGGYQIAVGEACRRRNPAIRRSRGQTRKRPEGNGRKHSDRHCRDCTPGLGNSMTFDAGISPGP